LAYAKLLDFKLYQMVVKSDFSEWFHKQRSIYVSILGFENHEFPDHVFEHKKVLYSLKKSS
jgi:hypothetical protein